jgi:small GTP-binding protein
LNECKFCGYEIKGYERYCPICGNLIQVKIFKKEEEKVFYKKIITAGDGAVGKTTLLHRYLEGKFLVDTKMTIGVEFFVKEICIEGITYKLQLWDLGGEKQFRFILKDYVSGANGALLMFDLTRVQTLYGIDDWVEIIRQENPNLPILFIGTKLDLMTNNITLDDRYALSYKEKYNFIEYLKTSSKTGTNINEAIEILTRKIIE